MRAQVLSNVLGNALKFTERGKVCVRVRMDKQGHNVVIKIQDTGCGMPTEDIAGLLEPFRQVDMSSRRKYGGTGLGLSIANQVRVRALMLAAMAMATDSSI